MSPFAILIRRTTAVAVTLIVVSIMLAVFGANGTNQVVHALQDAGAWLAQPFDGAFDVGAAKADVALNWGFAAVAYALAGGMLARLAASS